jgi:hypothetical protein
MIGAVGGIDQSSRLLHPQVINLDDHFNFVPKTQSLESPECQIPIFVDSNDLVTPKHTFSQTLDIVSLRTRACNLLALKANPTRKLQAKNGVWLRSLLPLQKLSKNIHRLQRN